MFDFGNIFKKSLNKVFYFLLAIDLAFIGLELIVSYTPIVGSAMFSVAKDLGYPEIFQYGKELFIVGIFLLFFLRFRKWGYLVWSFIFSIVLLDDSFQIHEFFGRFLTLQLQIKTIFVMEPRHAGELFYFMGMGLVIVVLMASSFLRAKDSHRKIFRDISVLFILFVFFGVIIDVLHVLVKYSWRTKFLAPVFSVMEEGGEMVVVSLIVGYLIGAVKKNNRGQRPLIKRTEKI